ncbi:MAG TPA: BLUF domain-containing protein [Phenylobacterium sp.]|nr:BLUF domain-containing protein [Phenylobacterium sp.]
MKSSLLYVSQKTMLWPYDAADVAAITEVARARNAELAVTGALISTRANFAQMLEGPVSAIEALMDSIGRDPRHREVRVVATGPIARRQFATWGLAYAGPSTYVAAALEPLLAEDASAYDIRLLMRLMREFARKYGGKV